MFILSQILRIILILSVGFFLITPYSLAHTENICPLCQTEKTLYLDNPPIEGEDVLELQQLLLELEFYKDTPDSIFDLKTEEAVKKFQESLKLSPDGIVDLEIWQALAKALEPINITLELPSTENLAILVDTQKLKLTIFTDNRPFHSFPIALGKGQTPSPIGNFKIIQKAQNWGSGFGTRWLGLNVPWGTFGIHGTNNPSSIGNYKSHGCIRMYNNQVEELYRLIPVNTPVIIVGNPFTYQGTFYKNLRQGDRGSLVYEVQKALIQQGYSLGVDGIWGQEMEKIVLQYREEHNLPINNLVDDAFYKSLGLK